MVTITPFLLIYVTPALGRWFNSDKNAFSLSLTTNRISRRDAFEAMTQAASVAVSIWLLFDFAPAIPYQPLYLLFIPVIWVGVRRGLRGATVTTPAITFGMTLAAWLVHAQTGSFPQLQLAMLVLGLTALCLGAMVTERKRTEQELRCSEAWLREAQRVARLGSWTLDPQTRRITWTEEIYRMMGIDPSLPPTPYHEQERMFAAESWTHLNQSLDDLLQRGGTFRDRITDAAA